MSHDPTIVSKVLVLESDATCVESIKTFCDEKHLVDSQLDLWTTAG